jgi:hypothetical protein
MTPSEQLKNKLYGREVWNVAEYFRSAENNPITDFNVSPEGAKYNSLWHRHRGEMRFIHQAPKGRNKIAQGNALG